MTRFKPVLLSFKFILGKTRNIRKCLTGGSVLYDNDCFNSKKKKKFESTCILAVCIA